MFTKNFKYYCIMIKMIVRNFILLIRFVSCSRKIREESTVRIKFTRTIIFTKNYYYYIIIIKIYRNMLEYLA